MKIYELLKKEAKASIHAQAQGNEFFLYDVIDADWGVSAKSFRAFLAENSDSQEIHIHINSPGGNCFEGRSFATAIRDFKGKVICHIDGLAASAASFVAVVCDEVVMGAGTMMMIHNAWTLTAGNKNDLLAGAAVLEKIDQTMIKDYAAKTGLPEDEIQKMMDEETWLSAEDAVSKGFADRIDDKAKKQDTSAFNLAAYEHAPDCLMKQDTKEPDFAAVLAANERRLQLYKFV